MTDEQIIKSKKFSPGIIDGAIYEFLAHSTGQYYYRRAGTDSWLKRDGQFVLLPFGSVLVARAEYLNQYLEEELKQKVEVEMQQLGKDLLAEAAGIISWLDERIRWSKPIADNSGDLRDLAQSIVKQYNENEYNRKKAEAFEWVQANPTAELLLSQLQTACATKDFEALYSLTGKKSEPLLITRKTHMEGVLSRLFSAGTVEKTIQDMTDNGSLWLRAKINVEKRYFS